MMYQHPCYPFTEEERTAIHKEMGLKETIIEEDIDAIINWFDKQPHLMHAPVDRDYVEKLLIASKGSREKVKLRLDHFYKYRALAPELIQDRVQDLNDANYDPWTTYRQASMLKLYEGKRISLFKITEPNASKVSVDIMFKNTIMLADLRMKYDYMLGDIWIFDLQAATISHILRLNLLSFQKFVNILQDGIGIKIYEVHIINATAFCKSFIDLLKQFVKPKTLEKIITYNCVEDLQKQIPKDFLPKDYGGNQPSMDEFKELYRRELKNEITRNYLINCCQQISDEKKRPVDFNEEYLVGSFKKLEFD